MPKYGDLLKMPQWQRKRLEVMARDNFACQMCGDNMNQLHVHHSVYIDNRMPWEYANEILMTVCHYCHDLCHWKKDKKRLKRLVMEHHSNGVLNDYGVHHLFAHHGLAEV